MGLRNAGKIRSGGPPRDEETRMLKKILIGVVIVAAVVGFFLLKSKNSGKDPAKEIKLVKAQKLNIYEKALAIGRIEPRQEIAVKSKVSGIIKSIHVEVGDDVLANQPLIEILPNPTPLEYADAKRSAELAGIDLEKAEAEYTRLKQLLESSLIPQKDYDVAENEYKQLKLRLEIAKERLALIDKGETRIADRNVNSTIKSPVTGTVLERRVNPGDPVVPLTSYQAGTELMILADMKSLIFKGTVDEIDVGKIREGMEAALKIGAIPDQKIIGRVSRISPKAKKQENSTLFDVEIEMVEKGDKVIRAGYSANADLVINKAENVVSIPERLVEFKDGKAFVEVPNGKNLYAKREITTGLSDGINIEVRDGLKEGEEIVERPPKEIK
jgi:HlyD family secretion protein